MFRQSPAFIAPNCETSGGQFVFEEKDGVFYRMLPWKSVRCYAAPLHTMTVKEAAENRLVLCGVPDKYQRSFL